MEDMTRLEILTLLLSLKGLLETNNSEKALEVINNVIAEAQRKELWKNDDLRIYIAILESEQTQKENGNLMYDFDEFAADVRKKYGIKWGTLAGPFLFIPRYFLLLPYLYHLVFHLNMLRCLLIGGV